MYLNIEGIDFAGTVEMGQFFMYEKLSKNEYVIHSENHICRIKINDKFNSILISDNIPFWKEFFNLNKDIESINKYLLEDCQRKNDNFGIKSILESPGIQICHQPYLETCIEYILSAQNNVKRIRKSMLELLGFGTPMYDTSTDIKYQAFPTIEQLKNLTMDDFLSIGAGFRAKYLYEFIQNFSEPKYSFDTVPTEKLLNNLMKIKGIGIKVASCIALYACEKYDVFPEDVWIKKIIQEKYNGNFIKPEKYAGILQVYLYYFARKIDSALS